MRGLVFCFYSWLSYRTCWQHPCTQGCVKMGQEMCLPMSNPSSKYTDSRFNPKFPEPGLRIPRLMVKNQEEKVGQLSTSLLFVPLFQRLFGPKGTRRDDFNMFAYESKDLLFKDRTKCLISLRDGITYKEFLGDKYYASLASLNTCNPSGNRNSPRGSPELQFLPCRHEQFHLELSIQCLFSKFIG